MAISYYSEDIPLPSIKKRTLNRWIKNIAKKYDKDIGAITYLFCSDEKILEVNNQYLQHNYYTDIITFDYSEEKQICGDLVISIETVRSNADKFGTDFNEELHRVIIHGILHLCGLKDKTDEEQSIMTDAENAALIELNDVLQNK